MAEEYCSETCATEHGQLLRRKRRQLLILWAGAIAIMVLVVFLTFGG